MANKHKLIPEPLKISNKKGIFKIQDKEEIFIFQKESKLFNEAKVLKSFLEEDLYVQSSIIPSLKKEGRISIQAGKAEKDESYTLEITTKNISIKAKSSTGAFWGIQTLIQLIQQYKRELPCLKIEDKPAIENRGFYHDITRGKVPTLDSLKALVRKMSKYKMNQLQLYVEHTFAFRAIPELWANKDPITAEEILELDEYCKQYHIELVPSLSCFGHLYDLLRLKKYEHLNELDMKASETPHSLYGRMAHYTADVSQKDSFEIIKTMIEEYIPLFSSKIFNICCDETFDLGNGKNKKKADKVGKGRLYVDFLNKVMKLVIKHDKKPMFWGDIILHSPELIKELPKDIIYLNWQYNAAPKDTNTKIFAKAKVEQYMCPGVSGWSLFFNDINTASSNIRGMTDHGKKYGATGVLNTDWGDCCHLNLMANSSHGLIFGGTCSWSKQAPKDTDFDTLISHVEWEDHTGKLGGLLRKLGSINDYHVHNIYRWVNDQAPNEERWSAEDRLIKNPAKKYHNKYAETEKLLSSIEKIAYDAKDRHHQDFLEFIWSAKTISWIQALIIYKKKYEFKEKGIKLIYSKEEIILKGYQLLNEFQSLWRTRNKESELHNVHDLFIGALNRVETLS